MACTSCFNTRSAFLSITWMRAELDRFVAAWATGGVGVPPAAGERCRGPEVACERQRRKEKQRLAVELRPRRHWSRRRRAWRPRTGFADADPGCLGAEPSASGELTPEELQGFVPYLIGAAPDAEAAAQLLRSLWKDGDLRLLESCSGRPGVRSRMEASRRPPNCPLLGNAPADPQHAYLGRAT